MISKKLIIPIVVLMSITSCNKQGEELSVKIFETSASGNQLQLVKPMEEVNSAIAIEIKPDEVFQELLGFGGSFTESSAYLLNQVGSENRNMILQAYFGNDGAAYSMTRTHMNSCDFSLSNYSYAPVDGDKDLKHFSIKEDKDDIIPMIKDAMAISREGFKLISSPWTAPPWMKDNNDWKGGKLLPQYYDTWALFFSKYINAYKNEGIDIWGITVENEPLGNGYNWESMHFSPEEMVDFVSKHLGPKLSSEKHNVKILGYDQNRDELKEWADIMYKDEAASEYFDGMAVHWYASTYDYMPEALQYTYEKAPGKLLIQSEACVDAEVPHWNDDAWYWKKEATDWGYDWAPEEQKYLHPKYVPVYRYARDIIGCLNNRVQAWIDWNMVLDTQGGPNWAKNWCLAPVIVDPEKDEVYFTPLYYTMAHFSKYIRPGAFRIGFDNPDESIMMTAAENPDGSIAVVILNMTEKEKQLNLTLKNKAVTFKISKQAIQTIIIKA
jgi:glucosylceramidase